MLLLLLLPFHAFLSVWLSSIFGHYTAIRLWKEVVLLGLAVAALCLLAIDHKIRTHTLTRRLGWLVIAYILLATVWGVVGYIGGDITAKALGYGLIVDTRFLIFFMVTWALTLRLGRLRNAWQWLVFLPAIIVILFGLLQTFVLPHDVLTHVGYGPATISPNETVNSNQNYYRTFSTLRGPNPLGAYLVIPLTAFFVMLLRGRRNWYQALLLAAGLVVLGFTFSRSAYIAVCISFVTVLLVTYGARRWRQLAAGTLAAAVAAGVLLALFWQNTHLQNIVFHTDDSSTISTSSNDNHASAVREGLEDVADGPVGDGPGTAGPASVYNGTKAPRIAENYYLQTGQELGWLGMTAFVVIVSGIAYLLWVRRDDPLALTLFASLLGISFIGLLSHVWTDDTIAYVWWGLAGVAIARLPAGRHDA